MPEPRDPATERAQQELSENARQQPTELHPTELLASFADPTQLSGAEAAGLAPDSLDDFQILKVLGKGSFGNVYLAQQISLGRLVALKLTRNDGGSEGRTMAPLEHPHIVQVFSETLRNGGTERVLCMQYVPGTTLSRLIELLGQRTGGSAWRGRDLVEQVDAASQGAATLDPLAIRDRQALYRCDFIAAICTIGAQLAEALEYAHRNGVLHRDIKPANILVSQYGRPLLADFNLSFREIEDGQGSSLFGGTLAYMSPEHLRAFHPDDAVGPDAVDERSDLFSLGVVLAELRTGALPFRASEGQPAADPLNLLARLTAAVQKPPNLPVPMNLADASLLATLRRSIQADPSDRFPHAAELAEALNGCRELGRIETGISDQKPRWFSPAHPLAWMAALIVLPQVIASVLNVTYNRTRLAGTLTAAQREDFLSYVIVYNLVVWVVCVPWVLRMMRPLKEMTTRAVTDEAALRRHLLALPRKIAVVGAFGWFSGILFFPLMMHFGAGRSDLYGHFALNLSLSGLIAIAYSALGTQYYALSTLYPQLWRDPRNIRERAREELAVIPGRVVVLQVLSGMIPLAGALLIVLIAPDSFEAAQYRWFRFLVGGLIVLGLIGFQVANWTCGRITRLANAFVGIREHEAPASEPSP